MYVNSEVKSAVRVLELLEFLARALKPVSLRDVVHELGYPKSSAHGLLATLVSKGYASRDEDDRYALNSAYRNGPGWISGPDSAIIDVAEPILRSLRDACGETTMLGVLNRDNRFKTIAKAVANRPIRYDTPFSGGMPCYCAAIGRVFLAALEPRQLDRYLARERLVRFTRHTITDKTMIRRIVEQTRRDGYAISEEEMDLGSTGTAAPVRNETGKVVAALNVATISERFPAARPLITTEVVKYADSLSEKLGWRRSGSLS